jgi:SAM-dependent methyltransferase
MPEPRIATAPRRWLFMVTILAGSFLLFLVQPMVARMALPRLGGAPNVWNSAMLVYQALLLAGYAYAHALSRLAISRQALVHLGVLLLAGLTLPIGLARIAPPPPGSEALWVPWLFVLSIGPVFFAVSAQAPLMQRWYAASPAAADPYPLYAASNLGSFAGLLAYPLLVEPLLPIGMQSTAWAAGYALVVLLVATAALARRGAAAPAAPAAATEGSAAAPGWRRILLWLALSAVPSGLMLSTTTYLTTDIFAMPLLWVIPLGLYLLSFSIAFAARRDLAEALVLVAPIVVCADGAVTMIAAERPNLLAAAASLVMLFIVAVALHTRLYATRPEPARLTQFYLVMAAGGALGGLFTALVAPLLFDWSWEHPLLILAAAALMPLGAWSGLLRRIFAGERGVRLALAVLLFAVFIGAVWLRGEFRVDPNWDLAELAVFVLLVVMAMLLAARRWAYVAACAVLLATLGLAQLQLTLDGARSRSYFGIYTIRDLPSGERLLMHGTTLHGMQWLDPARASDPTTYYGREAGVGRALLAADRLYGPQARIGVVGLGVGTLACYRRPGQAWTFFEIDPEVLAYSERGEFSYLARCAAEAPVVIGDARLKLAETRANSFDVLVVDAFSSDAIPLHLLTAEASAVYFRALAPDGLLLIHISNRFVDLEPVLAALARERGLVAALRTDGRTGSGLNPSKWAALSRDRATLGELTGAGGWRPLAAPADDVWRDDFASILPHLTWGTFF